MHEMGIANQIVEIASSYLPDNFDDRRVERVNLKIGKLTGIVPDSLRFCFDIITKDTPFSGAELKVEDVSVKARCNDCDNEWTVDQASFICPKCNGGNADITAGRELDIVSIEVAE
ncbi:MAG TPA: hydrogenase maturation nickel metallochaperone HypA [Deltaproteobacteria bacterium]|nr:hydrogenase maturation nickel metallochaperone HypA [Deltaproteobacteria bacterium]